MVTPNTDKSLAAAGVVEPLLSRSPMDGRTLGRYHITPPNVIAAALEKARVAQKSWARTPLEARLAYLAALRKLILLRRESLAREISDEIGKPLVESLTTEILPTLRGLSTLQAQARRWLAGRRERLNFADRLRGVRRMELVREPAGVVGVIGTWNYPLLINLLQIAPALAAGNAVIFKPSEWGLRSAAVLQQLIFEAGFPEDVFQVFPGDGTTGEALAKAGCDLILFTGSSLSGRRALKAMAEKGTPGIMEWSGHDAALVLADADVKHAVRVLVGAAFMNAGQTCMAPRRILVHRSLYAEFRRRFIEKVKTLKVGSPHRPDVDMGPLRDVSFVKKVVELVEDALGRRAVLLAGGEPLTEQGPTYFPPTVLEGVDSTMRLSKEEYFGPVVSLSSVNSTVEMVERAYPSAYGLTASVFGKDLFAARQVARALPVGTVWINEAIIGAGDLRAPFGGRRLSGYGVVHGPEGFWEMTRPKWIEITRGGWRPQWMPALARSRATRWLPWFLI